MNKLENTLENKARFFALYWGQELISNELGHWDKEPINYNSMHLLHVKNPYLELTPLSQISDEDAIEVGKIRGDWTESPLTRGLATINYIRNTNFSFCSNVNNYLHIIDYLRAKGYLVPYMGISEFDLVNYGWVRLKGGSDE